ncbi:MAG TPA: DsbA family protein [Chloroflexota bacterium]|nr:DsbA family protein [Chloroflexota bacterium]
MISSQATLAVPVSPNDHTEGPATAPVTLLEYGDYECPYCGQANQVVQAVQQQVGDGLRYAFRNFPLTQIHPYAYGAALAAEAAGAQGKFWEMHNLLYAHQNALGMQNLMRYADQLGLDMDKFRRAMHTDEFAGKIRADIESGLESGVQGTPTFFINGRMYEGPTSPQGLIRAIQEASQAR